MQHRLTRSLLTPTFSIRHRTAHIARTMSFKPAYTYVEAPTLAAKLKGSARVDHDIAIVDVRDDDFEGGNIPGCINVPSTVFEEKVEGLVLGELKDYKQVVFHCSLSQQRGPKSARIYKEARDAAIAAGKIQPTPDSRADEGHDGQEILVLRDGFANFGKLYKDDAKLVEKYDEEAWSYR